MFGKKANSNASSSPSSPANEQPVVTESETPKPLPAMADPLPPTEARPTGRPAAPAETSGTDLERLRDILVGSHSRSTNKRLDDLEAQIDILRQELTNALRMQVDALAETTNKDITAVRRDLTSQLTTESETRTGRLQQLEQTLTNQLETQNQTFADQLRTAQRNLTERLDTHESQQTTTLRDIQKEFNDRLSELASDFVNQLRTTHTELNEKIDTLRQEQSQRLRDAQQEGRQRNDELRRELLNLASSVEYKKTSRHELAQMLVELGQRLASDTAE